MSRQRSLRKKRELSEDEAAAEETEVTLRDKLEATKNLQKSRQRGQGLAAEALAGSSARIQNGDVEPSEVMGGYIKEKIKEKDTTTDVEREQFIQEQLDKRLGRAKASQEEAAEPASKATDIYAIPLALRAQKADQEDVSAWMTGIIEVPQNTADRLKNIEETEHAKERLLEASGARPQSVELAAEKDQDLKRLSYPMRFGKQSEKESAWREGALQRSQEPREWKPKRQKPGWL